MIQFTLYSRSYCHLCDEMRIALESNLVDIPYQLQILDVDQYPELTQLYDELVPVLFGRHLSQSGQQGADQQLCHYFLDADKVKAFCDQ